MDVYLKGQQCGRYQSQESRYQVLTKKHQAAEQKGNQQCKVGSAAYVTFAGSTVVGQHDEDKHQREGYCIYPDRNLFGQVNAQVSDQAYQREGSHPGEDIFLSLCPA